MHKAIERIKPQGTLKPSTAGTTHLPKYIRDQLGNPKEISYVATTHTAVLFNPSATPEDVLASLKVLMGKIRLRIVKAPI